MQLIIRVGLAGNNQVQAQSQPTHAAAPQRKPPSDGEGGRSNARLQGYQNYRRLDQ